MAQRFYQKASVQVAMVSGAVLLIVTAITIWHQRSELKKENKRLMISNDDKTAEIQRLETLLIPFRTLAIEKYSKADADTMKRLGETMMELQKDYSDALQTITSLQEQITSTRNEAEAAKLTASKLEEKLADRVLTNVQLAVMAAKLKEFSGQEYGITTFWNLKEPLAIANRIHNCLIAAGWAFKKPSSATFLLEPMEGIQVYLHPEANDHTKKAAESLISVLNEQGISAGLKHQNAPKNPNNKIQINVGTKP
jgi:gas vesicle protein